MYSKGRVLGYKRAKRNSRPNTSLIQIEGVSNKEEAQFYLGKVRQADLDHRCKTYSLGAVSVLPTSTGPSGRSRAQKFALSGGASAQISNRYPLIKCSVDVQHGHTARQVSSRQNSVPTSLLMPLAQVSGWYVPFPAVYKGQLLTRLTDALPLEHLKEFRLHNDSLCRRWMYAEDFLVS